MRKLVAALACRVGGSRLYGKPLQFLDIENRLTILEHVVVQLQTEPAIGAVVLGVAEGPENARFFTLAEQLGIQAVTGTENDVLGRIVSCGDAAGATDILRVTPECPFLYMDGVADAWQRHQANGNALTTIGGLPDGPVFELLTMAVLQTSHQDGDDRHRSEYVSLFIKEHRERFRIEVIEAPAPLQRLELRLTVDYPEDLVLCREVYARFKALAPRIPLEPIVEFLDSRPDLKALTAPYAVPVRWL